MSSQIIFLNSSRVKIFWDKIFQKSFFFHLKFKIISILISILSL